MKLPTLDAGGWKVLYSLLTEPLFQGFLSSVGREITVPKRPDSLKDESIRSFFSRRLSSKVADNNISAFVHGVYAGDTEKLSVKSIMPQLWYAEEKYGSIMRAVMNTGSTNFGLSENIADMKFRAQMQAKVWKDDSLKKLIESSNVISLRRGLESLVTELRKKLIEKGVDVKERVKVTGLDNDLASKNLQVY